MNTLAPATADDSTRKATAGVEARMSNYIQAFLVNLLPHTRSIECRREMRYPYPCLFTLTPVADDNTTPLQEPISVVGKNLSPHGIGFYHQHPIPYQRAIVTLGDGSENCLSLLVKLSWCRFTRYGWYDSGGRFLEVVSATMPPA